MIPLMKRAFLNEDETKRRLIEFISTSDKLSMGDECAGFEREFAAVQGCKDAILVNSGGSSNLAMLQTLKNLGRLKDGDRIGFSALTWSTNVMPIIQMGMVPVPVDCDPTTLNAMSTHLEQRLEEVELQAFFLTNVLGFAGDLAAIRNVCRKRRVILLEDNCEALGTELPEGRCGNFGVMASFSFFVAHHMSTIEGGMVCTNDEDMGEMMRIVRANGWDRNLPTAQQQKWRTRHNIKSEFDALYTFYDLGFNIRPTEITGVIGRLQLKFLRENITVREQNYLELEAVARTNEDLMAMNHAHLKQLSSFALPVVCKTPALRAKYLERFAKGGVAARPMIAGNMQKQPFYAKYASTQYDLPGADKLHDCGFYCGNYPELTREDIETLKSCLRPA
jgi:CDP-6-deoxy-D-xylo-4-hexulose-3-dehydrase